MERIEVPEAMARRKGQGKKYPSIEDERYRDGMMFPVIEPGFTFDMGQKIFAVGSCFARNIERQLKGFEVPTREFELPEGETAIGARNTILNEYNPGTMAQRIAGAATGASFGEKAFLEEKGGYADLLLPGGFPVSYERALQRRGEIDTLYEQLPTSDVLIVTLGLVEAWYDLEDEIYLNRAPLPAAFRDKSLSGRYELRILDANDAFDLLAPAIDAAFSAGLKKAIITVSPVPLQTTFSDKDVIIANAYSKATLRCTADRLVAAFGAMDYFPSYEMVTVQAGNPYLDDNVHVNPKVIERVLNHMLRHYVPQG